MAQGPPTKIISIQTSRLSIKNSLSPRRTRRVGWDEGALALVRLLAALALLLLVPHAITLQ